VSVRQPQIAGGGEVKLKDREKTSEAMGVGRPADAGVLRRGILRYAAIAVEKADDVPTLFIAEIRRRPISRWNRSTVGGR